MRIDYSEPKKSCSTPQPSQNRPRQESSGGVLLVAFVTALISLAIGFGSGWTLSQRSAKKAFKAAMEQQSLENSPQQAKATPSAQQPARNTPSSPAPTQQSPAGASATPQPTGGVTPSPVDPPLSFYKTLPGGQKNTALGSGINAKEEKPGKQPLQAPMPTNITRPAAQQDDDDVQKPPAQLAPVTPVKTSTRSDAYGSTVQVASYSLKSEAESLRSKLAAKGYSVNIVESHLADKGTWYRVRVGKHLDSDAAKELATKLGKGAIAIPDKE
jgi:cell division protein FtsN